MRPAPGLVLAALLALPAWSQPVPTPRPAPPVEAMSGDPRPLADGPAVATSARPPPRTVPGTVRARAEAALLSRDLPVIDAQGRVRLSEPPGLRPDIVRVLSRTPRRAPGGGLCGRASIAGEAIAPVRGRGRCGIADAVRVTAVSGVPLSRAARMDCVAARALDDWMRDAVVPVIGGRGGGLGRLEVAAGYACRTRNSRPGARLSNHALGRAIDISGFRLVDGETITVLGDWGRGADGNRLEEMWRRACGPFTTVLGPRADRFHRDHFHLDVSPRRRATYCR